MLHVLSVRAILLDHGLKKVNNSDLPLQPKVSQNGSLNVDWANA